METKVCKSCGKELPLEDFPKNKGCKDGHTNFCKICTREKRRTRLGISIEVLQTEGMNICPVCKRELPIIEFAEDAKSKTGRKWLCKACYSEHSAINQGRDKNYFRKLRLKVSPEYKAEIVEQKRKSRENNYEVEILRKCRYRAEQRGLDFNLELEDIVIPKYCPILEVPFQFGSKDDYSYSPSIDRIDNSKGYIKGNIQIISMKANTMKNSATPEELYNFCKNILRYSPNYIEKENVESENKESQR